MATDLNQVFLIGRLTRDPEIKYTSSTQICRFNIANNVYSKQGDRTSFIDCVAFGKTAEIIEKYTAKGKQIAITGKLQQNTWETQDGQKRSKIEVIVENVQLLSSRDEQKQTTKIYDAEIDNDKYEILPDDEDVPY